MSTVSLRFRDNIAVIRMKNGAANPISPRLVDDLREILSQCRNRARGLVLNSGAKFFSIGFDLPLLLKLNRKEMADFWYGFNDLCLELRTVKIPAVCMLAGHAMSGGNMLALTSDFRFASTDNKIIGFNEVSLGIPVPYLAEMILRQVVGDDHAESIMGTGAFMSFADAEKVGFVDEIHPLEDLEEKAIQKTLEMAMLEEPSYTVLKSGRVKGIEAAYRKNREVRNEMFLDSWFSGPIRKKLAEAAGKF